MGDSDLDKDVGNTQLHRIQFIQQLRSVFFGDPAIHWGKMRAACKQTNVNMIDVEQFYQTQSVGAVNTGKVIVRAGNLACGVSPFNSAIEEVYLF